MYPNLYYAFKDLFGVDWKFLRVINSFGFFVALSFILAAVVLTAELRRKSKQGLLQPTEVNVVVGKPASFAELILNFILGFVFGYKILGLFLLNSAAKDDPQAFIFSGLGSWPAGIILGLIFAGFKWWEKDRQKLPKPEERKIRFWPHDRVGEITILALVFGLLGAKLFDIFENWGDFLKHPSEYILSPAGLTFYGGLICAALAIWWYARKHKIGIWHLNDAAAPALMLAYAIGRIGCQVAGDGDWGIYNAAFRVDNEKIAVSTMDNFNSTLRLNAAYFETHYQSLEAVPHAYFPKPSALSFLPNWLFAYNYPHNVNEAGVPIPGCEGKYCNQLPLPVFPTPLYELTACLILFFILWSFRKRFKIPGTLFAFYLILNGIERFLIEKIRVNNRLDLAGFHPTQAEVISTLLVLAGIMLWIILDKRAKAKLA
ncbi:MAG TPA: prolipoprotein diacylglyceryl transferase family protein [Chitinophagaceae bacterium]|jgi:prolipoprotein diacylglyceryltransferase|nr:prolipoprotein diacylglyceryl transferase family protein [Chitinophagaceae bacterium]